MVKRTTLKEFICKYHKMLIGFVVIMFIIILLAISIIFRGDNFSCNNNTMKYAQSLFKDIFPETKIQFRNPQLLEKQSNHLKCRVDTDDPDVPEMYYDVKKDFNGNIDVSINSVKDLLSTQMGNLLNEFTRDILSDTTNQYHINRTIDQISHIVANTRVLFSKNNDYKMLTEEVIINARLIPDDMYNTDGFINDFNGKVILKPSDKKNSNDKGAFIVE
ncbi:hypothetical protein J6P92_07035, partial [bacterium]|nr:hypothetical protein [bacterium]